MTSKTYKTRSATLPSADAHHSVHAEISAALRSNPRLAQWSEASLLSITKIASKVECPHGQALPAANATERSLYLLHRGVFELRVTVANGRQQALRYVHPGGWVGLANAFAPFSALPIPGETRELVAHSAAVLWQLPLADFYPIMLKDKAVAQTLMGSLSELASTMADEVATSSLLTADGRVARCLLMAAADPLCHRLVNRCSHSPLRITQSEVAYMLGLSRQSVGTVLRALESAGLIRMGRQKIEILSAPGLREVVRTDGQADAPPVR